MTTKVTSSVLADTAVTPGTYGGTQTLPAFIVDAQGRITYAANITSGVITAGTRGQGADIIVPTIQYNALGQIVAATNNTIRTATTSVTGVVQLADSVSNTSTTAAATASAVKAAYDAAASNASTALTSAQANTGAGLISAKTTSEANVGAGLISTKSAYEGNVGAGLISTKSAYEGNVGAGLITVTNNYQANVGAVNIGLNNEITNRQANVGAAAISSTSASNLSSGTLPSARLSGSYTGITAVGGINTSQTGSAPIYGVRAWGAFTALGATLGAGNLSCSRTGAGVYVMTFTTSMPNANYAVSAMVDGTPGNLLGIGIYSNIAKTTSGFTLWAVTGSTAYDLPFNVIVVG